MLSSVNFFVIHLSHIILQLFESYIILQMCIDPLFFIFLFLLLLFAMQVTVNINLNNCFSLLILASVFLSIILYPKFAYTFLLKLLSFLPVILSYLSYIVYIGLLSPVLFRFAVFVYLFFLVMLCTFLVDQIKSINQSINL